MVVIFFSNTLSFSTSFLHSGFLLFSALNRMSTPVDMMVETVDDTSPMDCAFSTLYVSLSTPRVLSVAEASSLFHASLILSDTLESWRSARS